MKRVFVDVVHYYKDSTERGFEDLHLLMHDIVVNGWELVDGEAGKQWRYANNQQLVVINADSAIFLNDDMDSPVWYDVVRDNDTRVAQFGTFECAEALARHMSTYYNEKLFVIYYGVDITPDERRVWEYRNGENVSRETLKGDC